MVRLPDGVEGERFFEKRCPATGPPGWRPSRSTPIPRSRRARSRTFPAWSGRPTSRRSSCTHRRPAPPIRGTPPRWSSTSIRARPPTSSTARASPSTCATCSSSSACTSSRRPRARRASTSRSGLRPSVDAEATKAFALAVGQILESRDKKRVTVNMARDQRPGRVFVDWSQNDRHKTTVCAYSLRATPEPSVSTPISWDEVEAVVGRRRRRRAEVRSRRRARTGRRARRPLRRQPRPRPRVTRAHLTPQRTGVSSGRSTTLSDAGWGRVSSGCLCGGTTTPRHR